MDSPRTNGEAQEGASEYESILGLGVAAGEAYKSVQELLGATMPVAYPLPKRGTNPMFLPGVKLNKAALRYWTRLQDKEVRRAKRAKVLKERRAAGKSLHWTQKKAKRRRSKGFVNNKFAQNFYRTSVRGRYVYLRRNALYRGLEFNISYEEWERLIEEIGEELLTGGMVVSFARLDKRLGYCISNLAVLVGKKEIYRSPLSEALSEATKNAQAVSR